MLMLKIRFCLSLCLCAIMAIVSLGENETSEKHKLVEVWCGGDDGLTMKLRDAIENALESSADFRLNTGSSPSSLLISIPTHVAWKNVGKQTQIIYNVEYLSAGKQKLGKLTGNCWESAIRKCADKIVATARLVTSKKLRSRGNKT